MVDHFGRVSSSSSGFCYVTSVSSYSCPLAIGSLGLGQKFLAAKSPVEACLRVQGMTTWEEEGGLRERFLKANEVMIPILLDTGPTVQDCVLLHLRPSGVAGGGAAAAVAAGDHAVVLQAATRLT